MLTNWIAGAPAKSRSSDSIEVINPATEEIIDLIPATGAYDVAHAVRAARAAGPGWAARSPADRRAYLLAAAARLEAAKDEIVKIFVAENGKPTPQAEAEFGAAVTILRNFAELAVHLRSGAQQASRANLVFQHRVPRGVAACIVPWNFPIALAVENIVPHLAVGNTVVIKPSEKTPLATRMLVETAFGGLPPGVLNVVLGPGTTGALLIDADVDLVVFVGSAKTGRSIGEVCGRRLRKAVLELGGKDPFIVDDTVDVAAAAKLAATATFLNAGQICTSTERIYAHRSIFDEFVAAMVKEAAATRQGPLIDDLQLAKVSGQVEDALARGATVHCGGRTVRPGYFYEPTVLTGIDSAMELMKEETFGPIAPIIPFDGWDEAMRLANSSEYGLASIVCTTSAPRAIDAVEHLDTGMVKINTTRGKADGATSEPFKGSGIGSGYGVEFLYEITRQKSVHWKAEL